MADSRSSPMLPLRWSESPSGLTDPVLVTEPEPSFEASPDPTLDTGVPAPELVPSAPLVLTAPYAPTRPPTSDVGALGARPEVIVRTSPRRRKTSAAYWENGRIVVVMPSHVPRAERPAIVEWLVARVLSKRPGATSTDEALAARAAALSDRYVDGVRPASIRWVTNQGKRWGSCSTHSGEIRLSHRLRAVPEWVLDATIVHELAHLVHADHSAAFHAVADRYPRQRDAMYFLEGYSLGLQTTS